MSKILILVLMIIIGYFALAQPVFANPIAVDPLTVALQNSIEAIPFLVVFCIVELLVFYIFGFKKFKDLLLVALINVFSMPLINVIYVLSIWNNIFRLGNLEILLFCEIAVIVSETAILRLFEVSLDIKRLVLVTTVANVASFLTYLLLATSF